jgi:hypothetical protein
VSEVFELLVLGVLALVVLTVFGVLGAVFSLLGWLLVLPFKLIGLVFKGLGLLLVAPFLLLAGVIGVTVFGAGMLIFLAPAIPLILLALLVVWLVRRGSRHPAHGSA